LPEQRLPDRFHAGPIPRQTRAAGSGRAITGAATATKAKRSQDSDLVDGIHVPKSAASLGQARRPLALPSPGKYWAAEAAMEPDPNKLQFLGSQSLIGVIN